jgi:hypothetical protein
VWTDEQFEGCLTSAPPLKATAAIVETDRRATGRVPDISAATEGDSSHCRWGRSEDSEHHYTGYKDPPSRRAWLLPSNPIVEHVLTRCSKSFGLPSTAALPSSAFLTLLKFDCCLTIRRLLCLSNMTQLKRKRFDKLTKAKQEQVSKRQAKTAARNLLSAEQKRATRRDRRARNKEARNDKRLQDDGEDNGPLKQGTTYPTSLPALREGITLLLQEPSSLYHSRHPTSLGS